MTKKAHTILNNAVLEHKSRNFKAAKALYFEAIRKNPRIHQAHNNVGLILLNEKLITQAIKHFQIAVKLDQNNSTYLTNLATAFERSENYQAAFQNFSRVIDSQQTNPFIFVHYLISGLKLGLSDTVYEKLSNFGELHVPEILIHTLLVTYSHNTKQDTRLVNSLGAIFQFFSDENTIPINEQLNEIRLPGSSDDCLLIDLIDKLNFIGFFSKTIDHLLDLLDFASCQQMELNLLSLQGTRYQRKGDSLRSLEYFQQAYSINSKDKVIASKLSLAYAYCGMPSKAYDLVSRHKLTNMVSVYISLTHHDFVNAWKTYLTSDTFQIKNPNLPLFLNEKNNLKSILVYRFQGVGDEIMFLSCLDDLLSENPKSLTLECSSRLKSIIERSFPKNLTVIPIDEYQDSSHDFEWFTSNMHFDEALNISALPMYFRTSLKEFRNARKGYLSADPHLITNWKQRLSKLPYKFKIGFAWKGGINFRRGIQKSDLHLLKNLFSHNDICWVNMQYGDIEYEKSYLKNEFNVTLYDWDDIDYKNDLDQMAGLISNLDLLIQINNTSLHLAGALGKEAWSILLHSSFDIRWFPLENESECAWYPTVRLFRQNENESLDSLLSRINHSLSDWLSAHD